MILRWPPRLVLGLLVALCCSGCEKDPPSAPPAPSSQADPSDILYIDPEPDPFTTGPWWGHVIVYIDQDSVPDIELRVLNEDDTTTPWPDALWGTMVISVHDSVDVSIGTLDQGWSLLSAGDTIDEDLFWAQAFTLHSQIPAYSNTWSGFSDGFIGVRKRGEHMNYGWISVHSGVDDIAYKESGFERTPDRAILTGDTGQ